MADFIFKTIIFALSLMLAAAAGPFYAFMVFVSGPGPLLILAPLAITCAATLAEFLVNDWQ